MSDIGLPGADGIEGLRLIRKRAPKCQVVMLTVYDNTEKIFESLCAGACGYISKQTPLPRIREALVTVYEGGAYMSPGIRPPVGNRVFSRFHGFRSEESRVGTECVSTCRSRGSQSH